MGTKAGWRGGYGNGTMWDEWSLDTTGFKAGLKQAKEMLRALEANEPQPHRREQEAATPEDYHGERVRMGTPEI